MIIEESLPEQFKNTAFHPSVFVYAWKRSSLDKLLEEIMASNVAVSGGEAWLIEGEQTFRIIPLKNGDKTILDWKVKRKDGEDWYDFVERSVNESLEIISGANLEKKVNSSTGNKIRYHFDFAAEK